MIEALLVNLRRAGGPPKFLSWVDHRGESLALRSVMTSLEAKNDLEVMVLVDLAEIWREVAEHPAAGENLRAEALQLIDRFNELLPFRGQGISAKHYDGEQLLVRMARSLPSVLE